jgi:alkanesulfonate monooxygenase SsuD/methylene tetrahydromethanopterin reductase-like flavin-dependent oxidoreductase (luciferase family)
MVRFGVGLPTVGEFGDPVALVELAVAADEAGWDGVFFWDHLLFGEPAQPVANSTVVVAAAAARTSRVRLGVLVHGVARRRPGQLAAETASADVLSGGRVVFGASIGSYPEEWTRFGEDGSAAARAAVMDESLAVIDALWSGEAVEFAGEHVRVDGVAMPLRPVQRPRVPVWIGGRWPARRPFRRAARWDGVMPTHADYGLGETMPPAELAAVVSYVNEHRDPSAAPIDVILEGRTEPGEPVPAGYEEAGLTWWIEAQGWWRGGIPAARDRVAAGPPAS